MNTLEDKIKCIKTLLHYAPNNRVMIDENETADFFIDFFTKSKFHDPDYGMMTIGNYLESIADNPTMFITYEYNWSLGGCNEEFLLFVDENAKYKEGHGRYGSKNAINMHERGDLEYADIPEHIWDIILSVIYKHVRDYVNDNIIQVKQKYEHTLEDYSEFNKFEEYFKKESTKWKK